MPWHARRKRKVGLLARGLVPASSTLSRLRAHVTSCQVPAPLCAVYWVNQGGGEVRKAILCGGDTITIATGQSGPAEIAIVSGQLYWTAVGANQVMTIPE